MTNIERPWTSYLIDYSRKSDLIAKLITRDGKFDNRVIQEFSDLVLTDPDSVVGVIHEICKALFFDRGPTESKTLLLRPIALSSILGRGILSQSREEEVEKRAAHRNAIIACIQRNHSTAQIPSFIPSNTLLIRDAGGRFIFKERTTRSASIETDGDANIVEAIQTTTYQIPRFDPVLSRVQEQPVSLEYPHVHMLVSYTPLDGPTKNYIDEFPLSEGVLQVFDKEQAPDQVKPQDVALLWAHISQNIFMT